MKKLLVLLTYHQRNAGDILSEDAILKWYNEAHSDKGKNVFRAQMKKMVEWLQSAEEESDSESQPQEQNV